MVNCVECGAPMGRASEACEACGARPSSGHLNGTPHASVEDEDGLVYDSEPPRLHEEHRATELVHEGRHGEPSFVSQPLQDDPTVRTPAFASAPLAAEVGHPRAGFARRAAAMLVDLVVLGVLDAVLLALATSAVLAAERLSGGRVGDAPDLIGALLSAGSLTLTLGYFSVLHARASQTLGKAALGIRVEDAAGGPIALARSVLRTLGYVPSLMFLGAGFLLALGPSRRALHDRIAGTVVVRTRGAA